MAKSSKGAHVCPVGITDDVRKYDAGLGIGLEESLNRGMKEVPNEFVEKGGEVYTKA